ncbi:MAG: cysteine-rich CWC family protein [Burkholderiaceae bacterium]|nr:cysteine-rich CWC family protein [Burkholderiaceae bacterium]
MNTDDTLRHLSWMASCPLCGQPNQCAVALGRRPQSCWCMNTPVSLLALALLPEQERGQRCICPTCAQGQKGLPS